MLFILPYYYLAQLLLLLGHLVEPVAQQHLSLRGPRLPLVRWRRFFLYLRLPFLLQLLIRLLLESVHSLLRYLVRVGSHLSLPVAKCLD